MFLMGLFTGSITTSRYKLDQTPPADFRDKILRCVAQHAFKEIDPSKNPELSYGWVQPMDPGERITSLEQLVVGRYIVATVRRDTKTVAPAQLKIAVRRALSEAARDRRSSGRPLTREQVQDIRITVRNRLLNSATPSTALYEMAWNFETGDIWYSTTSSKPCQEFVDLFESTFGMFIERVSAGTRAADYCKKVELETDLDGLERTLFR
jgi:hypothetical protein